MPSNSLEFRIYITASGLGSREVVTALGDGSKEDADDFQPVTLEGLAAQAVVGHHRSDNGGMHSSLFIIVDANAMDKRGVLLVSLDEYHGFDDAVRYPPTEARNAIHSLSIGNEDWYTVRQDLPNHEWFALYDLLPPHCRFEFGKAMLAMNQGLQDAGVDDAAEEGDSDELPRIYQAAQPDSRDISHVSDGHAAYARDHDLDPWRFAVIDEEYQTQGVRIAQARPAEDSFYCRGLVAGELLRWIFVGFVTWEEAKEIAIKQASS